MELQQENTIRGLEEAKNKKILKIVIIANNTIKKQFILIK